MLKVKAAFSGFSVDDLAKSKKYYAEVLGLPSGVVGLYYATQSK
jgi:extradiol dioxygenase family protein